MGETSAWRATSWMVMTLPLRRVFFLGMALHIGNGDTAVADAFSCHLPSPSPSPSKNRAKWTCALYFGARPDMLTHLETAEYRFFFSF
jgi:hypothetical protein